MFKRGLLCLAILLVAAPAWAGSDGLQADLFSPASVSGQLDLRLAAANGERSWVDHGFGKTRVRGGESGVSVEPYVGDADLIWRPHLTWDLSAVVDAEAQQGQRIGAGEAYLLYRPMPLWFLRYSARVGLMYPPVSQEHEGPAWSVARTITPSALNSWIGEEVKVVAAEGSLHAAWNGHAVGITAAVFGWNDTSGTLLATRGWALDDIKANTASHYALPPLGAYLGVRQAHYTTPVSEIDGRAGGYARLDFSPVERLSTNLFYYDNGGDLTSEDKLQWAWDTRFWNAGASYDIDPQTQVLAQALWGDTKMGFKTPGLWVDVRYAAAYVLLTHAFGDYAATGRLDAFSTASRNHQAAADEGEHGWAVTADLSRKLSPHATALIEALHVSSHRLLRQRLEGLDPDQDQTVLQAALRLSY